jgi:predicted nucleic-acid-binding protein
VIALDTNVILRWILRDDEAQAVIAEKLLGEPCWINTTVLLELGWVLQSRGKLSRDVICDAMMLLITLPEVHIDRLEDVRWALKQFRSGADFADMLHLASAAKVDRFVTFDRKMAKQAGENAPVPVETLSI